MKQASKAIPFRDILADAQARRVSSSVESIDALKKSISSLGLLDPMIVEGLSGDKYRLCAGRNRYTAIKSLIEDDGQTRFDEVPCTVLEFDDHELVDENYKNYKISQVIFDSNDKRSQLTKFEQARHYAAQKQQFPHLFPTDQELAKFNNKPVNEVVEAMRLLALDQNVINRVEESNLQHPGTIPFMCLEEIAEAAALPKRPLPPEGQMKIIDLLVSPDLTDKRALVARDKMKILVTAVRKEYAPDPRGRKPKSEPQGSLSSDGLYSESQPDAGRDQEAVVTKDANTSNNFNVEATNTSQPESLHSSNFTAISKSLTGEDSSGLTHESDEGSHNSRLSDSELAFSKLATAVTTSETEKPSNPVSVNNAGSPTLAIVDLSINNALSALRKGTPVLTREQYQERAQKLEELRQLLESAAFSLT